MIQASPQIDRIVREVLRRLAETPSSSAPKSCPSEQQPVDTAELAIGDRVVTLESLRGRLDGVRRLAVDTNSVVTPAVRDHLRENKISLQRRANPKEKTSDSPVGDPDVAIAVCDGGGSQESFADAVPASIPCTTMSAATMAASVRQVAAAIGRNHGLGVVVTRDPFSAVCLANREPGVRAALAASVECVEQAIATAGVNLLVVDPTAKGSWQIKRLVTAFCRNIERQCPGVLLTTP